MPYDSIDELRLSAASLSDRRAPRRSKRLSHSSDSSLDMGREREERHSAKKRKEAAQQRQALGDITNLTATRQPHQHYKQPYATDLCTATLTDAPPIFHAQAVDDECDGDLSLDDALADAPGMDTTDEEDKGEEDADSSELDNSLDEDELLFSANRQRARQQRDMDESKEGDMLPPPLVHHSAFNCTTLISLAPAMASETHPLPPIASPSALSPPLSTPPPPPFFPPPPPDPRPLQSYPVPDAAELLSYLHSCDARRVANARYMTCVQHDLSFAMRAILVDWLLEVSVEYGLQPHTLLLCVSYIDRFLSARALDRTRLQLLGVSALLVAAKYWELRPPLIDDFLYISDHTYTRDEVVNMERALLLELRWEIGGCTALDFTRVLLWQVGPVDAATEHMAHLLVDLWLLEQDSVGTRQSTVGGACLVAAVWAVSGQQWIGLPHVAQFGARETRWCVEAMLQAWRRLKAADEQAELEAEQGVASPLFSLKGVRNKYSRPQYGAVIKLPVRAGSPFDV